MKVRFAILAALATLSCVRERPPPPRGVLNVSQEQASSWIRNFNPLTTAAAARWPTLCGVYEPMFVFNSLKGEYVPWLATGNEWRDDLRTLRVTVRSGVLWSDGQPFTARDIAFTFGLLKKYAALDRRGVWGFLTDVTAPDDTTVDFAFSRVFLPGFDELAPQPIVAEHDWKGVADPVAYANPNPIATGPFTEVRNFQNQVFELGRNPHYWQEGKPEVEALRFPAYPSNERANLGLVFDELDWAGNFVPAIDRVFVGRAPDRHKYWFPLTGSTIFLYPNTTLAPFDDVRVRKAISMSIDRALVNDVALYGYSRPSDATGLSDALAKWRSPEAVAAGTWTNFDVAGANKLLDEAGLARGPDGMRRGKDGLPLAWEVNAVSGWSDWVRAAQVIARGLRAIGIAGSVKTYDFSAWSQRAQEGHFSLSLGWSFEGPTPYTFYRWLMSSATVKPVGTTSMGNWHRFASPAADELLASFEQAADPAEQHRIVDGIERVFVNEAPAIPLYPNPSWGEYNTSRFEGFPTAADPYADPSPNKIDRADILLVLTHLKPR